jgi:hypothetical protein
MGATCSSETLVDFQQTKRRYVPGNRTYLKIVMALLMQMRGGTTEEVHKFTGLGPGLIRVVAPNISGDSSTYTWLLQANFDLRRIQHSSDRDELLLSAAHSRRDHNSANRYYCLWDVSLHIPNNFDGPWRSWYHQRLLINERVVLYSVLFQCQETWQVFTYNENLTDRTSLDYDRLWKIKRVFDN